jgi:hypothetical protein
MDTPDDMSIHPKGLALLLNQPIQFDALAPFDRGVVLVACTVVVRSTTIRLFCQRQGSLMIRADF